MRSSHIRALMEEHLAAFFQAVPEAIPPDLSPHVSPIFALGMPHGLTIAAGLQYAKWLYDSHRAHEAEAGGIAAIVGETARAIGMPEEELHILWRTIVSAENPSAP